MVDNQCDQNWQNFATSTKFYKSLSNVQGLFSAWKIFEPILAKVVWFGQLFNVVNGQLLKININASGGTVDNK